MAYQLNKTDGSLLTEIIDGKIDENSTNLIKTIVLFIKLY